MTLLSGTTLAAFQAGSTSYKTVVSIEGYRWLLSDAPSAAVLDAYAGTAWDSTTYPEVGVLPGLFVELHNEQKIDPWHPFGRGGTCILRVMPESTDQFGIDTHRRAHGAETSLTATVDRDDTAIPIATDSAFTAAPSTAFIGSECVKYSAISSTTMTASQRGMYSPFKTGTGSNYFANHHRVGTDPTGVALQPVVTQDPRTWIGRWVAVRMHKWDGTSLNSRDDALLAFAGRIASIADDPNTGCTVVELKHVLDVIADSSIHRDPWGAECPDGVYTAGGSVDFVEVYGSSTGGTVKTANTLSISAGRYAIDELCATISNWLGGELAASRIGGTYNWTINSSPQGYRTKCHFSMPLAASGTTIIREWRMTMPREIAALMGLVDETPQDTGTYYTVSKSITGTGTTTVVYQGGYEPYRTLAFHFGGMEGLNFQMELENERGAWVDQSAFLPSAIKVITDEIDTIHGTQSWGIFLIDEKALAFGNYDSTNHILSYVYMAPWPLSTDDVRILPRFGRRFSDTNGPVTVRQVLMLEGSFKNLIAELFYSTGTTNYNHATYDTLSFGLGLGIPGELLGTGFETSLANLPQADMPAMVIIDEPTKLSDVLSADLMIRRAFPVWRNTTAAGGGGLIWHRWQTPVSALAVDALDETNKAAPWNSQENHRPAAMESNEFQRPIVKIDYNRDFGFGRGDQYNASLQLEDQSAVDDGGNNDAATATIKLRNVYAEFTQSGLPLKNLISGYLEGMPMFSRPARKITRSIDLRYYEGLSPGDIVTVHDLFMRDPLTGQRTGPTRAATIVRIAYDPGGLSPGVNGSPTTRQMTGEVDLYFLDTHRGGIYGPAAMVDYNQDFGSFSAGYDSTGPTLYLFDHKYSENTDDEDYLNFAVGDAILITEIDPSNTASPTQWSRTIASIPAANEIGLDSALSSPAWDSTKKYRVTYDHYAVCTASQQDHVFQADGTTQMIESTEVADHYAQVHDPDDVWTAYAATDNAEFLADSAMGDGKTLDAGNDAALANLANMLIDRKTAKNSPYLWAVYVSGYTGAIPTSSTPACVMYCSPLFFGTELLSNNIRRQVTLSLQYRVTQNPAYIGLGITGGCARITLSRECPIPSAGEGPLFNSYDLPIYKDPYVQSPTYTTTSTSWTNTADWTVNLNYKGNDGIVWLTIEAQNVDVAGISKCVEGIRISS